MEKIGHKFELRLDKTQNHRILTEKFWNSTGVPCHFSEKIGKSDKKRIRFSENFGKSGIKFRIFLDFQILKFWIWRILKNEIFGNWRIFRFWKIDFRILTNLGFGDFGKWPIGSPGFSYRVPGGSQIKICLKWRFKQHLRFRNPDIPGVPGDPPGSPRDIPGLPIGSPGYSQQQNANNLGNKHISDLKVGYTRGPSGDFRKGQGSPIRSPGS